MFKTSQEIDIFFKELQKNWPNKDWSWNFGIAINYLYLANIAKYISETKLPISLLAQDVHHELQGAYTSSVSATQLKDINVHQTLIGHSECRDYLNQSDELINKKVLTALSNNIKVVLCCGESLTQKQEGISFQVIESQLTKALNGVSKEQAANIIIAYEPVWSIGTGLVAAPEEADAMAKMIKQLFYKLFEIKDCKVLYGGSVKPTNLSSFIERNNIDGVLVGGAGLEPALVTDMLKI